MIVSRIIETLDEDIEKAEYKQNFGILVENIPLKDRYIKRLYYPFYIFRRFVYMCVIVLFAKYPMFQLWFLTIVTILPVYYFYLIDFSISCYI